MLVPHVVCQGETVASIVAKTGGDPEKVWHDAKNDALRRLRNDPAILSPGDVLFVPEKKPAYLKVKVGGTNRFTSAVPTQTVKLALRGQKPLAGARYVIRGIGEAPVEGTTDGDGVLSVAVPVTVSSFVLELPERGVAHRVLVGHLDPARERSGIRQRLENLGYGSALRPILEGLGLGAGLDAADALAVFQLASGKPPTGEADDVTLAALIEAHGT